MSWREYGGGGMRGKGERRGREGVGCQAEKEREKKGGGLVFCATNRTEKGH